MFKLSKESKVTFVCLMTIPILWIITNHFGLIDSWKTKSLDLRLSSNLPGARGEILHNDESKEFIKIESNKTIPKIPKIVYVNFDAATLAMDDVGERPWDRAFFRDMSLALFEKGNARVLSFDFGFTPKSVSKMVPKENSFRSDSAMGELISAYPDRVVLGCLYSGVPTPFVKPVGSSAFPPIFKDGYSVAASHKSGKFHYPESPTYPLQNYSNNKYLGRVGSFTVPPFRAVDNVPRWVPLWFPSGGKAHAYNLLGGKRSNLPFEMPVENAKKIFELEGFMTDLDRNKSLLSKELNLKIELVEKTKIKLNLTATSLNELTSFSTKLDQFDEVIKTFRQTVKDNPAIKSIIETQLTSRLSERNVLIGNISHQLTSNKPPVITRELLLKQQEDVNATINNLQNSLNANPALKAVLIPQIQLKRNDLNKIQSDLLSFDSEEESFFSKEEEKAILQDFRDLLDEKEKEKEKLSMQLSRLSDELQELKEKMIFYASKTISLTERVNQLKGLVSTMLVETNSSLRLVYKSSESGKEGGGLIDSLPNEVPLIRDRPIFTLGIESLLAYYGLDYENVEINEDKTLKIISSDNELLVNAPLTEKQFVEVNWFSAWTLESKEKELVRDAKKAFGDGNYDEYRSLIVPILKSVLSNVEDFPVPENPSDLPVALKELGVEEEEVEIAINLLSRKTESEKLPSFDQLMNLIDGIAYYFSPPSLKSKYNPMCGMRDVLQNSRFHDQISAKIKLIEDKIESLEGPNFMGKINQALINNPSNEKLIQQKATIEQAIETNKKNLSFQREELVRINDFFSCFEDAIILIGPEEKTFQDLAPTPFDKSASPKVGVHGNLIKTLTSGKFIKRLPIEVDHAATFFIGIVMALLAVYQGNRSSWVQAGGILLLLGYIFFGFFTFSETHVVWPITAPACAGISTSFIGLAVMVVIEQKAKGRLKGMFGSYVSSELVEQMVESGEEPSLGGEETAITAFFSDVQAFSSFSELLSPTGLVDLMNEYLTAMTNILQEERGTLDKYIGDAIVAMYGAPIPMDDHAYQSVKTAILMQQRQIELREKWKSEGDKWPEIVSRMQTRIGCNTGTATVGNMGALDRFNYTMMGDMVNLAARCESGAKAYGAYIMITEETKLASEQTRDDIAFRYLDKIVVKGRKQPVAMFEPTGFMSELTQETQDCLDCFSQGIEKYLKQDWLGALKAFEKAKSLEPNKPGITPGVVDNPSMILIDRCKTMKDNPPGEDWDGVYVMTTK